MTLGGGTQKKRVGRLRYLHHCVPDSILRVLYVKIIVNSAVPQKSQIKAECFVIRLSAP